MHAAPSATRAVVCICGAIGGFDGPAMLYPRLGFELPRKGVSVARVNYRAPNDFDECVLDTLAALIFLKGTGHQRAAIVGHSFGGAVAINAGTASPVAVAVIAISSQLAGAHVVAELAPKPLLLIHGTTDAILPHRSSELIYERAQEPKRLMLLRARTIALPAKAMSFSRWLTNGSPRVSSLGLSSPSRGPALHSSDNLDAGESRLYDLNAVKTLGQCKCRNPRSLSHYPRDLAARTSIASVNQ